MNVYCVTLLVIGKLHTQSGSFSFLLYFLISKRIIQKKKKKRGCAIITTSPSIPLFQNEEVPFELELIGYFFTFSGTIVEDKSILSLPSLQELQRPCPFFLTLKTFSKS